MNNTEETLNFEQKHKEDPQRLRGFRLLNDDFMSKVFEDKACAKFLLQIILQRHDIKIQSAQKQYDIKNLHGRPLLSSLQSLLCFVFSYCIQCP